jgi:polysaccharide export outer membrane protein
MVKAIWAVACSLLVVLQAGITTVAPVFAEEPAARGSAAKEPQGLSGATWDTPVKLDNSVKPRRPIPPSQGSQADPSYRLGPEDQLRISVWDNKELTLDLVVRPDGKISMPLIQDVVAEGLTASELASSIQEKLAVYILDPAVSVIVLQVNAPKYYVMGYVTRPGTYPLRGEMSVLQALALAGGFTQFASPRSIKLIRNVGGKQDIRKINYYNLIDEGGEGNYLLKSGDTIVVP